MQIGLRYTRLIGAFLLLLAGGCGQEATEPSEELLGSWKVTRKQGMSVPHSFFWLTMDYVEFRDDGTVLGLMA